MRALKYKLSIPGYILTKTFNKFKSKNFNPMFQSLTYCKDEPEPQLIGENWVKLKSLLSGVCGSDIKMLQADESFSMEPYASFPCILGHENVAEIKEIGNQVHEFKIGDRVVINPVMSCFVHDREPCIQCSVGNEALCENFGEEDSQIGKGMSLGYHKSTGGGWSELFQAHKSQLYKVPNSIPNKRAILVDPFSSILQPICDYAQKNQGEKTVFIYGAGTIGLLAVAGIKSLKLPWKVIIGFRHDFQKDMANEFGADEVINTGDCVLKNIEKLGLAKIRNVSVGKPVLDGGVDVVFDCIGNSQTIDNSLRIAKTRGEVILVGTASNLKNVDPSSIWFREVKISGTCMSRNILDPRDKCIKSAYSLAISLLKDLKLEKLVTNTYALENYKKALYASINKRKYKVIKVAFDPNI